MSRLRVTGMAIVLSLAIVFGAWAGLRLLGLHDDPAIVATIGVVAAAVYATARLRKPRSGGA